jgi:2-desacetyl-2-hydroxyethyl bacteriochlorophyllide A dehydrogenase
MRAVTITAPKLLEIGAAPDPAPRPGEVVLAVAGSGICGTDLHIFEGEYPANLPVIPGHEFAGEVVAVGAGSTTLAIGDRVTADPNIPCLHCRYCHEGRANLCTNYAAVGVTQAGAAAEYVAVPHHLCVRLPDEVDLVHAALVEPLSCALHAFDLLGPQPGRTFAVYGSGTMGLLVLQLAQRFGARSVDVIDVNEHKLATARELGCSTTATSAADLDPGGGWDVVVDATGVPSAIQDGLDRTARGGTFVQFGVSTPEAMVSMRPFRIYDDEIRIIGAVCPLHSFERSADLLAAGAVDVAPLISDRVPLESYAQALELFSAGRSRKIIIVP